MIAALFACTLLTPVLAQMRGGFGGRGGGVARPGFAMGRPVRPAIGGHQAGPGVARHGFGAGVVIGGFPGARPFGGVSSARPFHHPHRHFCGENPFFCNPFHRGVFNPFFGGVIVGPWWGWSDVGYYDNAVYSSEAQQAAIAQQQQAIADLREELRQERRERRAAEQEEAAPSPAPAPAARTSMSERPITPTVLVFRDGRRAEVGNYAIVGSTLYEFAPHRTKKIQLSDLDLAATEKINEERDVEFHPPGERHGVAHP